MLDCCVCFIAFIILWCMARACSSRRATDLMQLALFIKLDIFFGMSSMLDMGLIHSQSANKVELMRGTTNDQMI